MEPSSGPPMESSDSRSAPRPLMSTAAASACACLVLRRPGIGDEWLILTLRGRSERSQRIDRKDRKAGPIERKDRKARKPDQSNAKAAKHAKPDQSNAKTRKARKAGRIERLGYWPGARRKSRGRGLCGLCGRSCGLGAHRVAG